MSFAHPGWLAAGLLACLLLAWLWRRHDRRQQAALARFVSPHLRVELTRSFSVARRRAQRGLFLLAVFLLCGALAQPLIGFRWEQISRRGNEIIFAVDTSRSMSTPDIKPDRLTRAKLAIDDFVNRLDGDAVGIVAFAGSAFLVCPMTLDYGAFHETLSAIDTNTIPRGGTNIASAIREAQAALRRRPGSDKILILVTDGEDLEGGALAAAQAARQQDGLTLYTVGVGTAGGDLIPLPADQGGGFIKDENGAFVKSRLDEPALTAMATATGGFYVPLGTQGEGLQAIYDKVLGPLAKHDLAYRQQKVYTERYQWPLAGSLGSLLASLIVGTRRRAAVRGSQGAGSAFGTRTAPGAASGLGPAAPASAAAPGMSPRAAPGGASAVGAAAVRGLLGLVLLAALLAQGRGRAATSAEPTDPRGRDADPRGHDAAAQADPATPAVHYNQGTAAYRAGRFPQAAQAFQQSIAKAPSSDPKRLSQQEDAYYDLGNSLYRAGQKSEQSAPQETLKQWNDAVKAYETALQLRPDDADSKYNRDLVKRKIEALKQNQNQSPNQKQDQNQKNQGQGQNSQSNSGQGHGEGKGQGQGEGQGQAKPPDKPEPPPTPPQSANNQSPQPGPQPPPPSPQGAGGSQGAEPPADPGHKSPASNGQPQGADQGGGNPDQKADEAARAADEQHQPGQMSREEARELLDSVKGDERRAPVVPLARRDAYDDQQQPVKNW